MSNERTRIVEASTRALSLRGSRLVVKHGADKGKSVPLDRDELVVGTAPSSTLVLTDPTVSRNHAAIRVTQKGILVEDLESTNGVCLNGSRVLRAYLEPKDVLELGESRIRFELTSGGVELPISTEEGFGPLIGKSVAARRLFAHLSAAAGSEMTVLLLGETGVGKDLTAQAIHEASPRASGPFVVVDCGAVAPSLFDSELFGHVKGSFTGADGDRVGAFEQAAGGTLFLDEIGELPRELQPKLLRAIEAREVKPVGDNRYRPIDIRLVAATNRDLKLDVNRGLFREDLFYRLNVCPIRIPPLRERPEDIPLLAEHFREQVAEDPRHRLSNALLAELIAHPWPGNLRELRNRVERAVLLSASDAEPAREPTFKEAKARIVEAFEQRYFEDLLERTGGNVSRAARIAQMDRVHLTRILSKRPRR